MSDDFYDILGLQRGASDGDIKKAYRRLAMKYHPDRSNGKSEEDEENFKKVNEAYAVLSDKEKRAVYDQYGKEGLQGQFGQGGFSFDGNGFEDLFGNFDDIFGSVFGNRSSRRRSAGEAGADLKYDLSISLEQAAQGDSVEIEVNALRQCEDCRGTGAKTGTSPRVCPVCNGTGQQTINRGFLSVASTCRHCHGVGHVIDEPCQTCHGQGRVPKVKRLSVDIPAGIDDGMRLRMPGAGEDGLRGGPSGDLYLEFTVKPHPIFEREGMNLHCRVPISFADAALGTSIEVPSLDSQLRLKVPEGTQSGGKFRFRGRGMPSPRDRGARRGDLLCEVVVETPQSLTAKQKQLLSEFQETLDEKPDKHSPTNHGWFEKLKGYLNTNGNAE